MRNAVCLQELLTISHEIEKIEEKVQETQTNYRQGRRRISLYD